MNDEEEEEKDSDCQDNITDLKKSRRNSSDFNDKNNHYSQDFKEKKIGRKSQLPVSQSRAPKTLKSDKDQHYKTHSSRSNNSTILENLVGFQKEVWEGVEKDNISDVPVKLSTNNFMNMTSIKSRANNTMLNNNPQAYITEEDIEQ